MAGPSTVPSASSSETGRRRRLRHRWVQVHRWLGLTFGTLFAVLGLTGSVLSFYPEIDRWLNPQQVVAAAAPTAALQPVLTALRGARPAYDGAWRLEMPLAAGLPVNARYYRPPETAGRRFAPFMATVDPQTLAVTSQRFWGDYAVTWIYDLHYTLLLAKPGRIAVGAAGIFALLSVLSGLYLWWPKNGRRLAALRPRIRAGAVRAAYDWHVLGGVYGLLLTLAVVVSGVFLAWPEYLNPLVAAASPLKRWPVVVSTPQPGQPMIDADAAVAAALARLPGGSLRWLETPAGAEGVYRVNIWQPGDPGRRFPRSNVWVDAYSGVVLAVRDWQGNSAGDTFLAWQHPLHNGEAFGMPGRILVCLGGLLPALLWTTGLLRWLQKRRAHRASAARAGGSA